VVLAAKLPVLFQEKPRFLSSGGVHHEMRFSFELSFSYSAGAKSLVCLGMVSPNPLLLRSTRFVCRVESDVW
jgi:hypothetical protein